MRRSIYLYQNIHLHAQSRYLHPTRRRIVSTKISSSSRRSCSNNCRFRRNGLVHYPNYRSTNCSGSNCKNGCRSFIPRNLGQRSLFCSTASFSSLVPQHFDQIVNNVHHHCTTKTTTKPLLASKTSVLGWINLKSVVYSNSFSLTNATKKRTSTIRLLSTSSASLSSSSVSDSSSSSSSSATRLVDSLLQHTQSLMNESPSKHHLIAFSGGIDSSLVAALIHQLTTSSTLTMRDTTSKTATSARAVLGVSPAVSKEQIELARYIATDCIGIDLELVRTTEGTDPTYIENSGQACYACKTHLYTCMEAIATHYDTVIGTQTNTSNNTASSESTSITLDKHNNNSEYKTANENFNRGTAVLRRNRDHSPYQLYNGTNADDMKDPTRIGLIAASEFNVLSPLSNITKEQVRIAAKQLGLPNWNYAASPCLRSRLALGVHATSNQLNRIEKAEQYIKSSHILQQAGLLPLIHNLRVRLLSKNRARIEIDSDFVPIIEEWLVSINDDTSTDKIHQISAETSSSSDSNTINIVSPSSTKLKSSSPLRTSGTTTTALSYFQNILGFASVTVQAFKSGSVSQREQKTTMQKNE